MNGTCKLCNRPNVKLADSHVIPKGLYEGLHDPRGATRLVSDAARPKRIPTGVYDQFVCAGCENRFGPWDQHIQEVLQPANLEEIRGSNGQINGWQVKCFDYEKCQLFFVSLLWRIHAATREPFEKPTLCEPMAHLAATSILQGRVGDAGCFGVVLSRFDHDASVAFLDPVPMEYSGVHYWRVPFPRYSAEIKVDRASAPPGFEQASLKPGAPWYLVMRDFEKSQELKIMKSMLTRKGLL